MGASMYCVRKKPFDCSLYILAVGWAKPGFWNVFFHVRLKITTSIKKKLLATKLEGDICVFCNHISLQSVDVTDQNSPERVNEGALLLRRPTVSGHRLWGSKATAAHKEQKQPQCVHNVYHPLQCAQGSKQRQPLGHPLSWHWDTNECESVWSRILSYTPKSLRVCERRA